MKFDISAIVTIVGVITILVNIATQVIKQITWDKIPTNLVVFILSEVFTLLGLAVYIEYTATPITWLLVAGAVVIGILVSHSAMFGYDKFIETIKGVKDLCK